MARVWGCAMRLSRAERSLLVDWWFTVDRALLAAVLVIVGAGLLLSLAASPSIALKRGLPIFYFVERHVVFALASVAILLAVSLLSPAQVRRLALVGAAGRLGDDGAGALRRHRDQRRAALAAYRRLLAAALGVRQAGVRGPVRLAAGRGRAAPRHAGHADGRLPLSRVRQPARAAARRRPGAAGEPRVGRAVPARRPAAALVLHACGRARDGGCSRPT